MDRSRSAHFEHSIAIADNNPDNLGCSGRQQPPLADGWMESG